MTKYGIKQHQHLFAAWAASRAASVSRCRFKVTQGRAILEASGFVAAFSEPEKLPTPAKMDNKHREWRTAAIKAAKLQGLTLTHGVVSKLINCYLKSRFVCGGHHAHRRVHNLHPPIDAALLKTLTNHNIIAIVYDFDGTLTPGAMQNYTILPALGIKPKDFWKKVGKESALTTGVTAYFGRINAFIEAEGISYRREAFEQRSVYL